MTWRDLVAQLKLIQQTNPRRVVKRLTLDGYVKVGSLAKLSSATFGLLTHVDFARTRGILNSEFEQLALNMPGLRGLAVRKLLLLYI